MGQWATNCLTNNKSFNKLCGLHIKIERLSPLKLKHGHQLRNSPMPQLRQQDSAMWSCQQYCSAVSAQFSARSGHSLETWGVPPPQSPQLWVRRDGKSSNSSIMELIPFYTCCHVSCSLSSPVLHNCDTHRSRRGSQQQSGFHTVHRSAVLREWYEMVIILSIFAIRLTFLQTSLLLWQLLSSTK